MEFDRFNLRFRLSVLLIAVCMAATVCHSLASEMSFRVLKMRVLGEVHRADIWYAESPKLPRAVLVLCPGYNGNGLHMIRDKSWQAFAKRENLALVGIHFESPVELLAQCQGYYQVSRGSGELLLEGIGKIYGRDLPILLFGFSGGAHFTTRFIAWKPERVLAWCAGGAGVLEAPIIHECSPPGVMACGENDPRLGGALGYFKQGRAVGKPWLWVEMPEVGHSLTEDFERFAKSYFSVILADRKSQGLWVDIDQRHELTRKEAEASPSLSGWLPDRSLLTDWLQSHVTQTNSLTHQE